MKYNLNQKQHFYYNRALLGLACYTLDELKLITKEKRKRISRVHAKSLLVLERLKYKKIVESSNSILNLYFSSGNIYKQLIQEDNNITKDVKISLSPKDLGLNRDDILTALLESGVLGPNFLKLE